MFLNDYLKITIKLLANIRYNVVQDRLLTGAKYMVDASVEVLNAKINQYNATNINRLKRKPTAQLYKGTI